MSILSMNSEAPVRQILHVYNTYNTHGFNQQLIALTLDNISKVYQSFGESHNFINKDIKKKSIQENYEFSDLINDLKNGLK